MSSFVRDDYNFNDPIWDLPLPSPESLDSLNEALASKNYLKILESAHLFWLLFCKEFANNLPIDEDYCGFNEELLDDLKSKFTVTISTRNQLNFVGSLIHLEAIKATVEKIRCICTESIKRNCPQFYLVFNKDFYRERVAITDVFNATWNNPEELICEHDIFNYYFTGRIERVFKSLDTEVEQRYNNVLFSIDKKILIIDPQERIHTGISDNARSTYLVKWSNTVPIHSSPILENELPLDDFLNVLRNNNEHCDLKIRSPDGSELSLHKLMLIYRGCNLSQMIVNNKIEMPYSSKTVQAFIEYLYLGDKKFISKYKEQHDFNANELFELSTQFRIDRLACCIKEICRLSTDQTERAFFTQWTKV